MACNGLLCKGGYMDGLKAINEINELQIRLNDSIKIMGNLGRKWAMAERDYRVAEMQETLKQKDQGVAATLINTIVKGMVAEEKFRRDEAEALWKTAQENVNAIKLQIRVLDNQIEREWGNSGK